MRTGALGLLVLALGATLLTGCSNPDASTPVQSAPAHAAPQNAGEPVAPAPPSASSQLPAALQPTPQQALLAFAERYVNWSYRTLAAEQRTLAAISVGGARLSEQQAAVAARNDTSIARGHISNRGQIVSIAPDALRQGWWAILTREQTDGSAQYEGLPAIYHVTLAQLAHLAGGYAVEQWLPQS